MINSLDVAWCAGFMSADGCFTWCGGNDGKGGTPTVTVSQVNPSGCKKFAEVFNGKVDKFKHNSASSGYVYRCNVYGKKAIGIMLTLYPLLSDVKQKDVLKVINKWKNRPKRGALNAAKTHCKHGHEYTQENTYVKKSGGRECRTCQRLANKRYIMKKRENN